MQASSSRVTLEDIADRSFNINGISKANDFSSDDTAKAARDLVRTLDHRISNGPISLLGTADRQDIWRKAVKNMSHMKRPLTRIGLCGVSGSGKSSVINALLGFRHRLVPTSGFGAGTATVTEVSYHDLPDIHGSVSFVSEDEWRREIHALLDETTVGAGEEPPMHPPANNLTWSKIKNVYSKLVFKDFVKMTPEEVLNYDPAIRKLLGTTIEMKASDVKTFSRQIDQYATGKAPSETPTEQPLQLSASSSSNQPNLQPSTSNDVASMPTVAKPILRVGKLAIFGPRPIAKSTAKLASTATTRTSIWPLITMNCIKCNAEVLSTGAILVDLPGSGDVNQVRDTAAENYISKCDAIWIDAPIERAKDSSVARDFLGKAMQRQLLMDQSFSAVTLITTKCDSVVPDEIARNLHFEDGPEYRELDFIYQQANHDKTEKQANLDGLQSQNKELVDTKKDLEQQLDDFRNELTGLQAAEGPKRPASPHEDTTRSPKRQRNSTGGPIDLPPPPPSVPSNLDDSQIRTQEIHEEIATIYQALKIIGEHLPTYDAAIKDAKIDLSECNEKVASARLEMHRFCSLKRSEIACTLLRQTFLPSLTEPSQGTRPAPETWKALPPLPIFCCSPREYDRLTKKDDHLGPPTCSKTIEDTGIPGLRAWCMHVARRAQIEGARQHISDFKQSVASMLRFFEGSKTSPTNDYEIMKARWASDLSAPLNMPPSAFQALRQTLPGIQARLAKEFSDRISEGVKTIKDEISSNIGESCRAGAKEAASSAPQKAIDFGAATKWQTYAATLRRYGCWKERKLNEEFNTPMSEEIAFPWAIFFRKPAFVDIKFNCDAAARTLLAEVITSSPPALAREVKRRVERCTDLWSQRENAAMEKSAGWFDVGQKEASRVLASHVEYRLAPAYDDALTETGRGSHLRKQEKFNNFMQAQSAAIYNDVAEKMVERLLSGVDSIETYLTGALSDAAKEMEVDIAALWDSVTDDKSQLIARADGAQLLRQVARQLDEWDVVLNKHKLASAVHDTFPVLDQEQHS